MDFTEEQSQFLLSMGYVKSKDAYGRVAYKLNNTFLDEGLQEIIPDYTDWEDVISSLGNFKNLFTQSIGALEQLCSRLP